MTVPENESQQARETAYPVRLAVIRLALSERDFDEGLIEAGSSIACVETEPILEACRLGDAVSQRAFRLASIVSPIAMQTLGEGRSSVEQRLLQEWDGDPLNETVADALFGRALDPGWIRAGLAAATDAGREMYKASDALLAGDSTLDAATANALGAALHKSGWALGAVAENASRERGIVTGYRVALEIDLPRFGSRAREGAETVLASHPDLARVIPWVHLDIPNGRRGVQRASEVIVDAHERAAVCGFEMRPVELRGAVSDVAQVRRAAAAAIRATERLHGRTNSVSLAR